MNKKITLLFFFLIVLIPGITGFTVDAQSETKNQITVTGVVIDTTRVPIPYATFFISLPAMPSNVYKAVASDEKGSFRLSLPKGEYIVKVTSVGYKDKTVSLALDSLDTDLGSIILQESITQLQEFVVKPLIEQNAREIIYNITSDPDREKSNMLDMFAKVPLLSVIDDKIVAENDPRKSIIILRNGRQDALFSGGVSFNEVMLKLPAMGFTDIRVLLDKPKKYENYDYVISVTADKSQRLFGAVGESGGSYRIDRRLDLSQRVTASADKIRMAATAGYEWSKPLTSESFLSTQGAGFSLEGHDQTESTTKKYTGNLNFSRDISEKQYIAGRFSLSLEDNGSQRYGTTEHQISGLAPFLKNNRTVADRNNDSFEGYLSYNYDIKPGIKILSMSYTIKALPSDHRQMQTLEEITANSRVSTLKQVDEHEYSHYLSIDYIDRLTPKISLTGRTSLLVANNERETREYDGATPEPEYYNRDAYDYFNRSVRRFDGLLSISWLLSRNMNLSAGIRPDYMFNSSRIKMISGTQDPTFYNERDWAYDANVGVRFTFHKKTKPAVNRDKPVITPMMPPTPTILNLSYRVNQSRPSYLYLSNYVDDSNPDYLRTGNPYLENEKIHNFSVGLMNPSLFNPSITFRVSNNKITNYWYQTSDNKTVSSYINGGIYNNISIGLNKTFILKMEPPQLHMFTLLLSGGYTREKIEGRNRENYNAMLVAQHQIVLFSHYQLVTHCIYTWFNTSGYSGMNINDPLSLRLSITRSFRFKNGMRLQAFARCDNAVRWNRRIDYFVNSDSFSQLQRSITKEAPVSFGFRLNYGSFKVKPVKNTLSSGVPDGFAAPKKDETVPEVE